MALKKELPTALPWYENLQNQIRFRENNKDVELYRNITPVDENFIPFVFKIPKGYGRPIEWKIKQINGITIDISNNIGLLFPIEFDDFVYVYYFGALGTELTWNSAPPIGYFWMEIKFPTSAPSYGKIYYSELMFAKCERNTYLEIIYSNDGDIEPIRYRNGFKQIVILDTFLHTAEPEIEEEGERDGENNLIPTFVKMTVRQKAEVIVPDYMKTALSSLQMHDNIWIGNGYNGSGDIDRATVQAQTDETGAFSSVIIDFQTDVMSKKICDNNKPVLNSGYW